MTLSRTAVALLLTATANVADALVVGHTISGSAGATFGRVRLQFFDDFVIKGNNTEGKR